MKYSPHFHNASIIIEDAGNKALALVNMPMFCDMSFPYIISFFPKNSFKGMN